MSLLPTCCTGNTNLKLEPLNAYNPSLATLTYMQSEASLKDKGVNPSFSPLTFFPS